MSLLSYSRDRILSSYHRNSIKDAGMCTHNSTNTNIHVIDIITRIIPRAHTREYFMYKVGLSRYIDAALFVGGQDR